MANAKERALALNGDNSPVDERVPRREKAGIPLEDAGSSRELVTRRSA